jgi:hypothetical protein
MQTPTSFPTPSTRPSAFVSFSGRDVRGREPLVTVAEEWSAGTVSVTIRGAMEPGSRTR